MCREQILIYSSRQDALVIERSRNALTKRTFRLRSMTGIILTTLAVAILGGVEFVLYIAKKSCVFSRRIKFPATQENTANPGEFPANSR